MAEVHGGHLSDYIVTQATISPYLITCPSSHIRDAIVQRGLYSISRAQVQFTVHEWRPRFGMGYDPPSHQVWVKLVGLPLQAWTMPEIDSFLRKFGHPLEILPFGKDAGHHRDITALVATKNPSRIPLAYVYREGDYSTQVDVYILRSRLWDDSYFPPPGTLPSQGGPNTQWQGNDALVRLRDSSSNTSSGNIPSEPTIDLSAWSARSTQIEITTFQQWIPKPQSPPYPIAQSTSLKRNQPPLQVAPHRQNHIDVTTGNQASIFDTKRIFALIRVDPLTIPRPIDINRFLSLLSPSTHSYDLGGLRGDIATGAPRLNCSLLIVLPEDSRRKGNHSARARYLLKDKEKQDLGLGPIQLKEFHSKVKAQSKVMAQSTPPSPLGLQTAPIDFDPGLSSPNSSPSGPSLHLFSDPTHFGNLPDPFSISDPAWILDSPNPNPQQRNEEVPLDFMQTAPPPKETHPALPVSKRLHSSTDQQMKRDQPRNRKNQTPTRRSSRIQERQSQNLTVQKSLPNPKSHSSKIPFNSQSHETPLDVAAAMSILQATGLQITQQVEDMIQQAAKGNARNDAGGADDARPTTPLHDHIPPREIPGEPIVL